MEDDIMSTPKGWARKFLYIDLDRRESKSIDLDGETLINYVGGRGLAAKLLWDFNPIGVDPYAPDNHLILSVGPLTAMPLPSSGKMVVASKSPLTHGYGDGNIGTRAAVEMRRLGYDAIVIRGRSQKPVVLYISCGGVEFSDAEDLWGLNTSDTEKRLSEKFGKNVGILSIGPAGENLVRFATVISEFGRSAGRPGMGAVMGSKKIKAIVLKGCRDPEVSDRKELVKIGMDAYNAVKTSSGYGFWMRQGTNMTVEWAQMNSVLPAYNFREGVFEFYSGIDGYMLESMRIHQKGCPMCNMPCGHVVKYVTDIASGEAELDYENVAMLGSNLGISPLNRVSRLNYLADTLGMDTISLGSVIGFAMEVSEKKLIKEKIEWGDYKTAVKLAEDIAFRRELGDILAEGVKKASEIIGGGSGDYAMHVKGLEISAYDCHAAEGMALAYGTSPIGAHHKDAWFITLDVKMGRLTYSPEKVERLVWMQNIRGGLFESITTCRFPWVELGIDLEFYPRLLKASTGIDFTWDSIHELGNRIYSLIRSFWIREYVAEGRGWSFEMDIPPKRWFKEPLTKGPLAGSRLDLDRYIELLKHYYRLRGWNSNGIPLKNTLEKLKIGFVADDLRKIGVVV
ncbi:MAG: aldehyde ferredoxin oxidoreductase family protein [Sulfolobales archaeon]